MCVCAQACPALWTVIHQAPLSMEFSRQDYWSRLPFPPPEELPDPRIKPVSLTSSVLAGRFFTTEPPGKPVLMVTITEIQIQNTVHQPRGLFHLPISH